MEMYKFENVKKFCRSSLVLDEQISSTFKPDNSLAGLLFRIFYSNQKVILVQNILSIVSNDLSFAGFKGYIYIISTCRFKSIYIPPT